MNSFTPGPWVSLPVVNTAYGRRIFSGSQYIGYIGDSDQETPAEANARLIAKAPDMLAMLKECHEALEYVGVWETPIGLIDRVYALIQEAEGK